MDMVIRRQITERAENDYPGYIDLVQELSAWFHIIISFSVRLVILPFTS